MILALLISLLLLSSSFAPEDTAALQGGRPEAAGDKGGQGPLKEEGAEAGGSDIDVAEIIFEHVGD